MFPSRLNNTKKPNSQPTPQAEEPSDVPQLYDLSKLRKMVDNDQEMINKMIDMFLKNTPDLLNEMKAFWHKGEIERLSKLAHKLKSSINLMGISTLYDNIRSIEKFAAESNPEQQAQLPDLMKELNEIMEKVLVQIRQTL
ncbi:MAG: Hpt domain-containing protein [Bacteroidia bacterium]|nr:Hpt domain-containing protein [Bacteroidia bacterium]